MDTVNFDGTSRFSAVIPTKGSDLLFLRILRLDERIQCNPCEEKISARGIDQDVGPRGCFPDRREQVADLQLGPNRF